MHPKTICDELKRLGAPLVFEDGEWYIKNADKIPQHYIEMARWYKRRVVQHLQGSYTDEVHAVKQTIDKIVDFVVMQSRDEALNVKLSQWLWTDEESWKMVMQLIDTLAANGWLDSSIPISNFETDDTDELCKAIFDRAMTHFKKVKT